MVNIIIYLILSAGIAGLIIAIKTLSGKINKLKIENAGKDKAIERAAQNIKALTDYHRAIKEIRKNKKEIITRIGNVQEGDDEEIDNILSDIITANNKRVQNNNRKRD